MKGALRCPGKDNRITSQRLLDQNHTGPHIWENATSPLLTCSLLGSITAQGGLGGYKYGWQWWTTAVLYVAVLVMVGLALMPECKAIPCSCSLSLATAGFCRNMANVFVVLMQCLLFITLLTGALCQSDSQPPPSFPDPDSQPPPSFPDPSPSDAGALTHCYVCRRPGSVSCVSRRRILVGCFPMVLA